MPGQLPSASILSLETSCPLASICLRVGGETVFESEWRAERSHNSRIFDLLKDAKPYMDKNPPSLILVGAGPGSYSGVRVALAAADGLALVYGAKVVSLPSWEALPHGGQPSFVVSDARRGGWALGVLEEGRMPPGLTIMKREEADAFFSSHRQPDKLFLTTEPAEKMAAHGWTFFKADLIPSASRLLDAWEQRSPEEQRKKWEEVPAPIYVREPHITQAKRSAWEKGRDAGKIKD